MKPTNLAFLRIAKRAERQDDNVLQRTFVDFGSVLAVLTNIDHQVIFGRRGTGKTHLLTVVRQNKKDAGELAILLDMRNLGSTGGIYADPTITVPQRATRLLIDVLAAIHAQLLEQAINNEHLLNLGVVGKALDDLFDSHTAVKVVGETIVDTESSAGSAAAAHAKLGLSTKTGIPAVQMALGEENTSHSAVTSKKTTKGTEIHRVNFGNVGTALRKIVDDLPKKRLWLLIDEWSEVPHDLQPLLADLLKRAVLPTKGITVKIAAIEQRSRFFLPDAQIGNVGIEIGADVSAALNLDDYMVFDNDQPQAVAFFKKLVFAHVCSALDEIGVAPPKTENELLSIGFTQANAFDEVVRACEGVPRDAIHILSHAAQRANDQAISVGDVRAAAQQWYQGSKDAAVSAHPRAKELLLFVVDKVIKERQAKAFLLKAGIRDPLIDFLYDERVLHVLRKGISAKDLPGTRFNVYGIDYGCYVDLINTNRAPKGMLDLGEEIADYSAYVPKTDLRSVRRCVLDLDSFHSDSSAKVSA